MKTKPLQESKICVIGLGYVGLPLAVEFGKHLDTVGFDINQRRIDELNEGVDHTLEVSPEELKASPKISFTASDKDIADCNVYIVTVPTPIDDHKNPDLNPLRGASRLVGGVISAGDVVIYESTVYPGATEEVCLPIVEEVSGLTSIKIFTQVIAQSVLILATRNTELAPSRK